MYMCQCMGIDKRAHMLDGPEYMQCAMVYKMLDDRYDGLPWSKMYKA